MILYCPLKKNVYKKNCNNLVFETYPMPQYQKKVDLYNRYSSTGLWIEKS